MHLRSLSQTFSQCIAPSLAGTGFAVLLAVPSIPNISVLSDFLHVLKYCFRCNENQHKINFFYGMRSILVFRKMTLGAVSAEGAQWLQSSHWQLINYCRHLCGWYKGLWQGTGSFGTCLNSSSVARLTEPQALELHALRTGTGMDSWEEGRCWWRFSDRGLECVAPMVQV